MQNVFILGYFGFGISRFNGQQVRTQNIYKMLSSELGFNCLTYDTLKLRSNPFSLVTILPKMFRSEYIVVIPAHNGVKVLIPFIVLLNSIFRKKLIYVAIGGWLPKFLKSYPYLKFFFKFIDVLCLQTRQLEVSVKSELKAAKTVVLPNFKFVSSAVPPDLSTRSSSSCLRVVFMSLLCKEKGLDTIGFIVDQVESGNYSICIDLYGPVLESERQYLDEILKRSDKVRYNGTLDQKEVSPTLTQYDVMIFPTHHMTEGFPGVILDAYLAGLGIVASKWDFHTEYIKPEFGFVFDHNDPEQAFRDLVYLANHAEVVQKFRAESFAFGKQFDISNIKEIFLEQILR